MVRPRSVSAPEELAANGGRFSVDDFARAFAKLALPIAQPCLRWRVHAIVERRSARLVAAKPTRDPAAIQASDLLFLKPRDRLHSRRTAAVKSRSTPGLIGAGTA